MAETEEQIKKNKAYCKILGPFFEFIDLMEMTAIQDSVKVLLMDYFDYGFSTMFLIPDIEKVPTFDIDKIDNLRKEIHRITHTKETNPNEIWLTLVEHLNEEYIENCTIEAKPITSKEIRATSIKGFIFPVELIEKMRDSVVDSNNKNQIIEFNLCTKDNIVSAKSFCENAIGHFRAYPKTKYHYTTTDDIRLALKLGIVCLGGTNEIYCVIRKGEYNEAYNKMQEIDNKVVKVEEMSKKYEQEKSEFLDRNIKSGNIGIIEIPLEVDELKKALDSEYLPGIQLGKYILSINVIQEMKDAIIKGEEEGAEIAFDLCAGKDNFIKARNKIHWEETYVMTRGQCAKGETFTGTFHTHSHLQQKVNPSVADLLSAYRGIECIGAREEIKCFLILNFNENDRKYLENVQKTYPINDELLRLNEERTEFMEKYFEVVTLI